MAEEKTPLEQMNESIDDLQGQLGPEVEGIVDKIAGTWWDKIKTFFFSLAAAVWLAMPNVLTALFAKGVEEIATHTQDARDMDINTIIDQLLDDIDDPRAMINTLQDLNAQYPTLGWLVTLLNVLIVFGGLVKAHTDAIGMKASQTMLAEKRPSLIPVEPLLEALFKDPSTAIDVEDTMSRLGIPDYLQSVLKTAAKGLLEPDALRQAYLRGLISDMEFNDLMKQHRLDDSSVELLKQLYEIIPPVQDIIAMAVREVFDPDVVAKFGQMENFPPEFAEWAQKQGLNTFWAKNYWAAHWNLPSPLQGFEMLHRDVIDNATLDMLLRALDIMPFWRDKLTEIAYNPLTRVDVRRMYALGVINREGVVRAYKDLGYNDYNAELMTEFTIAYTSDQERELTKTDIISLYKKNALTTNDAAARLQAMGYSEDSAYLLIYRADYEVQNEMKAKAVSSVGKLYVAGKITESAAIAELGRYNMDANEVNRYLELWDLDKAGKVRNLTVKEIERFYVNEILDEQATLNELLELGYSVVDANRFLAVFQKGGQ